MITEIEVTGLREMEQALDRFGPELAGNVIRPAMTWGAQTFRKAVLERAKATFQAHTGRLFREIEAAVHVAARGRFGFSVRGAIIRWRIGMAEAKHAPYGRFWEGGFRHIGRGKGKRTRLRRGQLQARQITRGVKTGGFRFMRRQFAQPAFDGTYGQVLSGIIERMRTGVEQVAQQVRGNAA